MKGICFKCGYHGEKNTNIRDKLLCEICAKFAPGDGSKFNQYISEKAYWKNLKPFRNYATCAGDRQKNGMIEKAKVGNLMSRSPFGYKISNKNLIPAENFREVEEIFEEFLNTNISLRQLSKKHNLSVNGLKKVLKNFTYIGKIKFDGQIHEGKHKPIVSSTLFNHVQNKLDKTLKKKK